MIMQPLATGGGGSSAQIKDGQALDWQRIESNSTITIDCGFKPTSVWILSRAVGSNYVYGMSFGTTGARTNYISGMEYPASVSYTDTGFIITGASTPLLLKYIAYK